MIIFTKSLHVDNISGLSRHESHVLTLVNAWVRSPEQSVYKLVAE